MVAKNGQSLVELLAQITDFFSVFRQRLLLPAVGDGEQKRNEVARAG
jgi:hypothetical protein